MEIGTQKQMPKYQCHKQVWALKIKAIEERSEKSVSAIIEDEDFAPITLSKRFVKEHGVGAGGYLVTYKGGYQSYSPAEAFEEGYTKL